MAVPLAPDNDRREAHRGHRARLVRAHVDDRASPVASGAARKILTNSAPLPHARDRPSLDIRSSSRCHILSAQCTRAVKWSRRAFAKIRLHASWPVPRCHSRERDKSTASTAKTHRCSAWRGRVTPRRRRAARPGGVWRCLFGPPRPRRVLVNAFGEHALAVDTHVFACRALGLRARGPDEIHDTRALCPASLTQALPASLTAVGRYRAHAGVPGVPRKIPVSVAT